MMVCLCFIDGVLRFQFCVMVIVLANTLTHKLVNIEDKGVPTFYDNGPL